jgi:hypothetical protein
MKQSDLEKFKKALDESAKKYNTPEKARYYLVYKLGTHNPDGSLTKEYGGDYTAIPKDENGFLMAEKEKTEYPQMEVCINGKYVMCQILTSWELDPPKYIVCNPLNHDEFKQPFLAKRLMGVWMAADLRVVQQELEKL